MNLQEAPQRIRSSLALFLALIAIGLMVLDSTDNLDSAFGFVRDPIAFLLGWTSAQTNPLDDLLEGPRDLTTARQQIADLEAQLLVLERENESLREIQGENQQLRALLNRAQDTPQYQRLTASVIAFDSNPYFQSIVINAGTNFGLRVGMPVESSRGLVGQIYRTSANASQVILLTDGQSSIPVRLGNSRATGILRGGGLGGGLHVDWIDLDAQVSVGEVAYTSGIGGRFPENIPVGRVLEVEIQDTGLHQTAKMRSEQNFEDLELIFIITDFEPIETELFELPEEIP